MRGIWADERDRLAPDQWVNVYKVDCDGEAVFAYSCQVRDYCDDEDYGLEPTDEEGELIPLSVALGAGS